MKVTRDLQATRAAARWAWSEHVAPALYAPGSSALIAALVTVDATLDAVLLAEGYGEPTQRERVWAARRTFSNYEALRAARHLRHQAVHHLGLALNLRMCGPALAAYARSLMDHGVDLRAISPETEHLLATDLSVPTDVLRAGRSAAQSCCSAPLL